MVTAAEVAAKMHDAAQGGKRGEWSLAISFRSDLGYGVSAQALGVIYRANGKDLTTALESLFAKLPDNLPTGRG